MELPYEEKQISDRNFIREFKQNTDSGDLTWHRDRESRIVVSKYPTNWTIQLDNQLPRNLNEKVLIPMGMWHRLIKGDGDLTIEIIKLIN